MKKTSKPVEQGEIIEPIEAVITEDEEKLKVIPIHTANINAWTPKTQLGKAVKDGRIRDISELLDSGERIMEAEIVDVLVPNMAVDLLMIGQAKGKFGGGQRRVFRQTQKKTAEGNKPHFATLAVIGNLNGLVGIGYGKSKETVPAREKAIRNAKLNLIKIRRGCGSWQCGCGEPHSIPFTAEGKCGSVRVKIMPAPKGTGLCVEHEMAKVLGAAGIKDVWSQTLGQQRTKLNLIYACEDALREMTRTKIKPDDAKKLGLVEGVIPAAVPEVPAINEPEEHKVEDAKVKEAGQE